MGEAKDYLLQHNISERLSQAVSALLKARPQDPTEFLCKHLRSSVANGSAGVTGNSTQAAANGGQMDAIRQQLLDVLSEGVEDGSLEKHLKELPGYVAPSKPGSVEIHGMAASAGSMSPILFAMDGGFGKMVEMDLFTGAHKAPEALEMNPFGQIPTMKDGNVCLAQSNAILRYLAKKYMPSAYGSDDLVKRAEIDWALDWALTNFAPKHFTFIWYPCVGFGPAPTDQAAVNAEAVENLGTFAAKFLAGDRKFVGGDILSIADYRCGMMFWFLGHSVIKAKVNFELPERIVKYVDDWKAALKSADMLKASEDFMKSKA
jgi:glutathione S-transferase